MFPTYSELVHVNLGLVYGGRIWELIGGWVIVLNGFIFVVLPPDVTCDALFEVLPADVLDDSLFVVLPADAEWRRIEHAAPSVAMARLWIPSPSLGHTVGCGNVRELTVYAALKFETKTDQFRTLPFLLSGAALTSVLMAALIWEAVLVMRSLLLLTLSVIHVE